MTPRHLLGRLLAGAFFALAGVPALAAQGGMPQLNFHDFPPQVVWLVVTFVVLYVVLAKFALPRVGEVLQMRADRLSDDIDRATALKAETDKVIAAYEKALAEARNQAATVSRETAAALAQKATERQTKVGADLATRIKSAEANIATAKTKAMADIQTMAAEIASDAAKRLVGLSISPAEAGQAVSAAMRERG